MDIREALKGLDPANDDHWTSDGLPRVDVVAEAVGAPVTRKQITDAVPDLIRPQPDHENVEAEVAEEPVEEPIAEQQAANSVAIKDFDAGYVVPEDYVVGMTPEQVYRSVELVDRAQTEFGRQAVILSQRRDAVDQALKVLGKRSELLDRARNFLTRGTQEDTHRKTIQRHLKGQQKAREERAGRLRKFTEAGVTPEEVAAELGGASKLDAALKRRKRPTGVKTWPSAIDR